MNLFKSGKFDCRFKSILSLSSVMLLANLIGCPKTHTLTNAEVLLVPKITLLFHVQTISLEKQLFFLSLHRLLFVLLVPPLIYRHHLLDDE